MAGEGEIEGGIEREGPPSSVPPEKERQPEGRSGKPKPKEGAKHIPTYYDLKEDLVLMSKSRLQEVSDFSLLQEGVGAVGMFFFSGAFWLLATLAAEHAKELFSYVPWFLMCFLSMGFGATLIWVSFVNYTRKRELIKKMFKDAEDSSRPT